MPPAEPAALNPAQRRVLELLGAPADQRPTFPPGLGAELRAELAEGIAPALALLGEGQDLFVSKHALGQVHTCEAHLVAERAIPFAWTVPTARGTVSHKAIELLVSWRGTPIANELVAEAIARLTEGIDGLAQWLQALDDTSLAELRNECTDQVAKFIECFPPLEARWQPRAESRLRVEVGALVLQGKVDLLLGRTRGEQAGKVIIDLKTGRFHTGHLDDLRFYALLEAMRLGVPPRLVAGYYLDEAEVRPEAVTEGSLRAALARTVDGVIALAELEVSSREPTRRAGPTCRWCPLADSCETGQRWLEGGDDDR